MVHWNGFVYVTLILSPISWFTALSPSLFKKKSWEFYTTRNTYFSFTKFEQLTSHHWRTYNLSIFNINESGKLLLYLKLQLVWWTGWYNTFINYLESLISSSQRTCSILQMFFTNVWGLSWYQSWSPTVTCFLVCAIINYYKPLMNVTFTMHHIFHYIACTGLWLVVNTIFWSVAGATFMSEFAPYTMHAPPLMRQTHQRFIVTITHMHTLHTQKQNRWKLNSVKNFTVYQICHTK